MCLRLGCDLCYFSHSLNKENMNMGLRIFLTNGSGNKEVRDIIEMIMMTNATWCR